MDNQECETMRAPITTGDPVMKEIVEALGLNWSQTEEIIITMCVHDLVRVQSTQILTTEQAHSLQHVITDAGVVAVPEHRVVNEYVMFRNA